MTDEDRMLQAVYEPLDALVTFYEGQPWSMTVAVMRSVLVPARDHILSRIHRDAVLRH